MLVVHLRCSTEISLLPTMWTVTNVTPPNDQRRFSTNFLYWGTFDWLSTSIVLCPRLFPSGKNMVRIFARRSKGSNVGDFRKWQSVQSLSPGVRTDGWRTLWKES